MTGIGLFDQAEEAERAGDAAGARDLYERLLWTSDPVLEVCPAETLRRVARCHHQTGDFRAAADTLEAALAVARALGTKTAEALVLNTQAAVAQTLGDLSSAERLYAAARSTAQSGGERSIVAMVDQNLGTLANTRGDFSEALRRYAQAIGGFEALNMYERRAPLLVNIGRLHTDLEHFEDAVAAFDEAQASALELSDTATQLLVQVNVTRLELARKAFGPAAASVLESVQLAKAIDDRRWTGLIQKQQGTVLRETGQLSEALRSLRASADNAEATGDRLLEAEVARELARTHWQAKHNRETLLWLNRSRRLFRDLQARHDVADVGQQVGELEDLFIRIVREWGASIESKDGYTQGHSERVSSYALALATAADLPAEDQIWFTMGGLLHDVGKVVVPLEILNKPGPLTPEEWVVMRGHSAEGERLLSDVEFPWDITPMVRHHHEAWDGSGYPDGLTGENIPWTARVLCVADVFDALTTARPYRDGYGLLKAIEIMDEMSGSTFDPELYRVFRRLISDGEITPLTPPDLQQRRAIHRMDVASTIEHRRRGIRTHTVGPTE